MDGLAEAVQTPGITGAAITLELILAGGMVILFSLMWRMNQRLGEHEKECAKWRGRANEKLGIEND